MHELGGHRVNQISRSPGIRDLKRSRVQSWISWARVSCQIVERDSSLPNHATGSAATGNGIRIPQLSAGIAAHPARIEAVSAKRTEFTEIPVSHGLCRYSGGS